MRRKCGSFGKVEEELHIRLSAGLTIVRALQKAHCREEAHTSTTEEALPVVENGKALWRKR